MKPYLRVLRPRQWTKNLFCFAGVLFAGKAGDPYWLWLAAITFLAFCAASSFVYIVNDITDRELDRLHPLKQNRPIASGEVGVVPAIVIAAVCVAVAVFLGLIPGPVVVALIGTYILANFLYSTLFKQFVIFDVMLISSGFILRVFAGDEAVRVPTSAWILLCTFFLALFLGFGKRRAELNAFKEKAHDSRGVLEEYSVVMLDRFANICGTLTIAAYAIFTATSGHHATLIITLPPVAFGLLRYLYLIERKEEGETPELVVLHDRPIQIAIALWLALYVAVLYFGLRLNIR